MTQQQNNFANVLSEYVLRNNVLYFTRQELLEDSAFMDGVQLVSDNLKPAAAMDALMQKLRDNDIVDFVDNDGTYRVSNALV